MMRILFLLAAIAWPVMTMAGPLPIERIEPGMMVWSAPECGTGQAGYRPVLETYRNRAPAVWQVSYDHDADPVTPVETLSASAEHPFWVEETSSFLPASPSVIGGRASDDVAVLIIQFPAQNVEFQLARLICCCKRGA